MMTTNTALHVHEVGLISAESNVANQGDGDEIRLYLEWQCNICEETFTTRRVFDVTPPMTETTPRPLWHIPPGPWWEDPNDNRIHDEQGNDVLDYLPVTEIGKRVNAHDALMAALGLAYEALARVGEQTEAAAAYEALEAAK